MGIMAATSEGSLLRDPGIKTIMAAIVAAIIAIKPIDQVVRSATTNNTNDDGFA